MVLKTPQIFLFFEEMRENVEKVSEISHKLLGELQNLFF